MLTKPLPVTLPDGFISTRIPLLPGTARLSRKDSCRYHNTSSPTGPMCLTPVRTSGASASTSRPPTHTSIASIKRSLTYNSSPRLATSAWTRCPTPAAAIESTSVRCMHPLTAFCTAQRTCRAESTASRSKRRMNGSIWSTDPGRRRTMEPDALTTLTQLGITEECVAWSVRSVESYVDPVLINVHRITHPLFHQSTAVALPGFTRQ